MEIQAPIQEVDETPKEAEETTPIRFRKLDRLETTRPSNSQGA